MRARSLLVGCLVAGASLAAAPPLTPALADSFESKIVAVQANAGSDAGKPRPTSFTEDETNSYLKFKSGPLLPTGLTEPVLTMHGAGRVTGRAVVDLDIVRQKQSSGGWFDPTSYLTGKLPVSAVGKVVTADGKGRFELETADINGIPVPKSLLAQMVNYFTRTADNPRGSSIDDTFELPAEIRRIDVATGRFTVVQ
ncbi:MAG: hypothetical protein AB7P34_11165 [Vicinamibacterales bacterium]